MTVTWLDEHRGQVWVYRSVLRPVSQMPLSIMSDSVIDPANIGPENRILTMGRELTAFECSHLDLDLIGTFTTLAGAAQ